MSNQASSATAIAHVDVGPLMDLALHMARRADDLALAGLESTLEVVHKSDGSPVTRVDREIEAMLRDTIEREHPRAGVLGEEYGEERGVGRWVLDPIDGTRELIAGDPRFATLIAYELEGETLVGVVTAPALQLRWWAGMGRGAGSSYRGIVSTARVTSTRRWGRARGLILGETPALDALAGLDRRRCDRRGVSWQAVGVATGEYDFAVTSGALWDVAPIGLIVTEAGGRAYRSHDETDLGVEVAVCNRHLAPEVSTLLA